MIILHEKNESALVPLPFRQLVRGRGEGVQRINVVKSLRITVKHKGSGEQEGAADAGTPCSIAYMTHVVSQLLVTAAVFATLPCDGSGYVAMTGSMTMHPVSVDNGRVVPGPRDWQFKFPLDDGAVRDTAVGECVAPRAASDTSAEWNRRVAARPHFEPTRTIDVEAAIARTKREAIDENDLSRSSLALVGLRPGSYAKVTPLSSTWPEECKSLLGGIVNEADEGIRNILKLAGMDPGHACCDVTECAGQAIPVRELATDFTLAPAAGKFLVTVVESSQARQVYLLAVKLRLAVVGARLEQKSTRVSALQKTRERSTAEEQELKQCEDFIKVRRMHTHRRHCVDAWQPMRVCAYSLDGYSLVCAAPLPFARSTTHSSRRSATRASSAAYCSVARC